MSYTSVFKITEQIKKTLGKGDWQLYVEDTKQALATVIKAAWFQGKSEGVTEINGQFVYPFPNLMPVLDSDYNYYYITVPSAHVDLPHNSGIQSVSYMQSSDRTFIKLPIGGVNLYNNLDSSAMGARQTYFVENTKMYFPLMDDVNAKPILLKLAVAFDTIDVEEQINISPDMIKSVVDMVIQQYAPAPKSENLNTQ